MIRVASRHRFMAAAFSIMHGHGTSNEMWSPVIAKEDYILAISIAAKGILHIPNKTEHGLCCQYNAWAWPLYQNTSLVTANED